jgi:competence protein ComEA
MSIRASAPDPTAAEVARRRLSQLGADLASGRSSPPGAPAAPVPRPEPGPRSDAEPHAVVRGGRHARERLTWSSRAAARAVDGVAPTLHGRFHVTAHHLTVVALVLSAAMALAAWLLVRSGPEPVPVRASLQLPPGTTPTAAATPDPTSSTAADASLPDAATTGLTQPVVAPPAGATDSAGAPALLVHVTGKVRRPGVVELPAGSRVVDAIEAAGGAMLGARLSRLNLARPLVDGEQVAVGVPVAVSPLVAPLVAPPPAVGATPSQPTTATAGGLVNLNTATQPELEELPGIGPVTATSILEWRSEHGGFSTVDELIEVSGIGEVTLAELRDLVTV